MNEALLDTITKLAIVGPLNVVLDEDTEQVGAIELARLLNVALDEATELAGWLKAVLKETAELARLLNTVVDIDGVGWMVRQEGSTIEGVSTGLGTCVTMTVWPWSCNGVVILIRLVGVAVLHSWLEIAVG